MFSSIKVLNNVKKYCKALEKFKVKQKKPDNIHKINIITYNYTTIGKKLQTSVDRLLKLKEKRREKTNFIWKKINNAKHITLRSIYENSAITGILPKKADFEVKQEKPTDIQPEKIKTITYNFIVIDKKLQTSVDRLLKIKEKTNFNRKKFNIIALPPKKAEFEESKFGSANITQMEEQNSHIQVQKNDDDKPDIIKTNYSLSNVELYTIMEEVVNRKKLNKEIHEDILVYLNIIVNKITENQNKYKSWFMQTKSVRDTVIFVKIQKVLRSPAMQMWIKKIALEILMKLLRLCLYTNIFPINSYYEEDVNTLDNELSQNNLVKTIITKISYMIAFDNTTGIILYILSEILLTCIRIILNENFIKHPKSGNYRKKKKF